MIESHCYERVGEKEGNKAKRGTTLMTMRVQG